MGDACRLPGCLPFGTSGGPWLPAPELSRRSNRGLCGDACRLPGCDFVSHRTSAENDTSAYSEVWQLTMWVKDSLHRFREVDSTAMIRKQQDCMCAMTG